MIWVVLAVLGIPLWLVAGGLLAAVWFRRQVTTAPEVFRARLRTIAGDVAGLKDSWPRRPLFARWVHDDLVIHRGLALARSSALGVARAAGSLTMGSSGEIPGLDADQFVLTLILDSGASVQLAAPADDRSIMVGPFAAALFVDGDEDTGQTVVEP